MFICEEGWDDCIGKGIPRSSIPEEIGDSNKNIIEHGGRFIAVLTHVALIFFKSFMSAQLHPPLYAAQDCGAFVLAEIVPGTRIDMCQDALHRLLLPRSKLLWITGKCIGLFCVFHQ